MIAVIVATIEFLKSRVARLFEGARQPQPPPAFLHRDLGLPPHTPGRCNRATGTFLVSKDCL